MFVFAIVKTFWPKRSVAPRTLSGNTSFNHSSGNAGIEANTEFTAPGVARFTVPGAFVFTAPQFATRLLSWVGSINCSDAPVPLAAAGQGGSLSYRTSSTIKSWSGVAPGLIKRKVSPLFCNLPLNSPATAIVLPKAEANASLSSATTRNPPGEITVPPGNVKSNPLNRQPERSKALVVEAL